MRVFLYLHKLIFDVYVVCAGPIATRETGSVASMTAITSEADSEDSWSSSTYTVCESSTASVDSMTAGRRLSFVVHWRERGFLVLTSFPAAAKVMKVFCFLCAVRVLLVAEFSNYVLIHAGNASCWGTSQLVSTKCLF